MEYKTLDVYKRIINNRNDDSSSDDELITYLENNEDINKNENNN